MRSMARETTAATEAIPGPWDRDASVVWSDEQLLRQFLSRMEESAEAAFATLIERHGPIVHRVCLDVLQDREDARDVAQAVFLVLARKAGSIRKPEALGPWLHGVAFRLARRVRSEEASRRAAERRKGEIMRRQQTPEVAPDPLNYDEPHEEVDRLPEKYRRPIILCYMQGRTQGEAARELGWPLGTVQVRLHRGRDRLRSRLMRRGVGLTVLAGVSLARSLSATARVPGRGWNEATAAAAVRFASGKGTAGLVAPVVTRLAESALAAMLCGPLKVVALLSIALLLSLGAYSLTIPLRRAVTVGSFHAELEPTSSDTPGPGPTPKLTPREVSTTAAVGTDRSGRPPARNGEGLEKSATPKESSRNPLSDGGDLHSTYTSPGRCRDLAQIDRRFRG